jgi:hypothetical protein
MAVGRGSANQAIVLALVLGCILLLHCEVAESAVYTVGGNNGWSFNTATWPRGKTFKAGDVLGMYFQCSQTLVKNVKFRCLSSRLEESLAIHRAPNVHEYTDCY